MFAVYAFFSHVVKLVFVFSVPPFQVSTLAASWMKSARNETYLCMYTIPSVVGVGTLETTGSYGSVS